MLTSPIVAKRPFLKYVNTKTPKTTTKTTMTNTYTKADRNIFRQMTDDKNPEARHFIEERDSETGIFL